MANYMGMRTTMSMETEQVCHLFQRKKKRSLHFCAESANSLLFFAVFSDILANLILQKYYIFVNYFVSYSLSNLAVESLCQPFVSSDIK